MNVQNGPNASDILRGFDQTQRYRNKEDKRWKQYFVAGSMILNLAKEDRDRLWKFFLFRFYMFLSINVIVC